MKKLSIIFAFFLLLGIGGTAAAQQAAYQDGTLVNSAVQNKIYLIKNGKKYWIRTPEIFNAYGFSWRAVQEAPEDALNAYRDVRIVSTEGDTKLYYIENNTRRWVVSPGAFEANGFSWQDVERVNRFDFEKYQAGEDLSGKITSVQNGSITLEITTPVPLPNPTGMPLGVDFSLLWNTWNTLIEKYRDSSALNTQKMVQGAAEGLVKSLDDPYTTLFKPTESKKFAEDIAGVFGGIGAELGYKNGIVIIAPLKDMPAEKAGLKAGDKIVKINDESTEDMTVDNAVEKIRGVKGTPVTLLIERVNATTLLEFTITRDTIKVPTIDWSMKTPDTAYIRIHNFFGLVENDFAKAVKDAKVAGMRKLILDLRNNPGGLLNASITIAWEFIPKGKLIVSQDFGTGKGGYEYRSEGGSLETTPIVVLVNGGSASAAEILAGALKDSRNITLVGEKTFGKGTVQEVVQMPQGTSLKVTVAKWIRPSGTPIEKEGITPDVVITIMDADAASGRDPQLDKALELVRALPYP